MQKENVLQDRAALRPRFFNPTNAALAVLVATVAMHGHAAPLAGDVTKVPVVFSGGHETDSRDNGRPVVLVAGALGVTPEVFRDAFSRVHPAPAGSRPAPGQERQNKAVLMAALGKYGITNDRLDQVSNYYRYVRSQGQMWPAKPAVANALVKNGVVVGYEIVSGGAGYSSVPTVTVPSIKGVTPTIKLGFNKDFAKNGAIVALTPGSVAAK
jgi:hypothetical protein